MKKKLSIIFISVCALLIGINIAKNISTCYRFERDVLSEWSLADKSSTIQDKVHHIDKFIQDVEVLGFEGRYNALWMNTPDNSFDANLAALKTLQKRLHEIEQMDMKSFEYQAAIQQITAQEQGEAAAMIGVFEGIYFKEHSLSNWSWIGIVIYVFLTLVIVVWGLILTDYYLN